MDDDDPVDSMDLLAFAFEWIATMVAMVITVLSLALFVIAPGLQALIGH